MAAGEGDNSTLVKDRLPHDRVRRVRCEIAGIGIVGHRDIAGRIAAGYQRDRRGIIHARIPGRAEVHRRGAGLSVGIEELRGEVLGFLDEGGMGGAIERGRHAGADGERRALPPRGARETTRTARCPRYDEIVESATLDAHWNVLPDVCCWDDPSLMNEALSSRGQSPRDL